SRDLLRRPDARGRRLSLPAPARASPLHERQPLQPGVQPDRGSLEDAVAERPRAPRGPDPAHRCRGRAPSRTPVAAGRPARAAPEGSLLRVLVGDNGSTDGSVEKVRAAFPAVQVLALGENRRFAGGNNAGLARALEQGADAVMLLNNDTEADPALLERLLLALEQDPGAGAAAPLIYFAPPSDRIWYAGGHCVVALGLGAHRGLRPRDLG